MYIIYYNSLQRLWGLSKSFMLFSSILNIFNISLAYMLRILLNKAFVGISFQLNDSLRKSRQKAFRFGTSSNKTRPQNLVSQYWIRFSSKQTFLNFRYLNLTRRVLPVRLKNIYTHVDTSVCISEHYFTVLSFQKILSKI